MNVSDYLKKNYWMRRVVPDSAALGARQQAMTAANYKRPVSFGGLDAAYEPLTQDDFLNEINPAAHLINSKYQSTRPIWGPTGKKDENGKEEYAIVGYDDIETVSIGLQEMIVSKKIGHLTGDKFWIANESMDEEAFTTFSSWADYAGLFDAYTEAVYYCERSGDSAILLFQDGDKSISYEVFAYEKGDTLYPGLDNKGRQMLCRQYRLNDRDAVDIFTVDSIETWVKMDEDAEKAKSWIEKVMARIKSATSIQVTSDDGYTRILKKEPQTGIDLLQVVYFRVPDIASGPVEDSCVKYERALSYNANEVKSSAFPILFVKSEKIMSLPPSNINHKTIGVKGTSETVKNSDAKFLTPPNSSDISKIHLEALFNNIMRGSMTALVEPEVLRQGADSSTTIKILFAPDIIWCKNRWIHYAKPVKHLVEVMKRLVGKVEGDIERYGNLRISSGQNIYVPQNEAETLKMELDMLYARAKSRKSVLQDIGNQHKGDYEQIMKEWEEELRLKSEYSSKGQEEQNPSKTPVNNQAAGKSIQQE